jgi:hypothetical protein
MRVFHFVGAEHGLSDIRHRRLKIATLPELNDPFELFGVDLRDQELRRVLETTKEKLADTMGLLCFSRNWHNPVLWSHYAARHTGVCLGFEAPDDHLHQISYSKRRVVVETEQLKAHAIDDAAVMNFLFTKYAHWRYEAEVRVFINLRGSVQENGKRFEPFADTLALTSVIVGARSQVTRHELRTALGELEAVVKTFKARLAFRTFQVVRQKRESLWP